jgi:hypothetical protein
MTTLLPQQGAPGRSWLENRVVPEFLAVYGIARGPAEPFGGPEGFEQSPETRARALGRCGTVFALAVLVVARLVQLSREM